MTSTRRSRLIQQGVHNCGKFPDLGTGKEQSITITANNKLSDEQLDAISDANTAIVKAQQYLAENRKTVDKDKKHELKAQISAVQKTICVKRTFAIRFATCS